MSDRSASDVPASDGAVSFDDAVSSDGAAFDGAAFDGAASSGGAAFDDAVSSGRSGRSGRRGPSAAVPRPNDRTRPVAASVAASGVVLAATAALVLAPVPTATGSGTGDGTVTTAVPAATTTAVCPGSPRPLDTAAGTDPRFSPVSATAMTRLSAAAGTTGTDPIGATALTALGSTRPTASLTAPAAGGTGTASQGRYGVATAPATGEPTVLRAAPSGQAPTDGSAVLGYRAEDGDLRGLAAAACPVPGNDLWLVGASTTVGRTAVLSVVNPGTGAATVDLELSDRDGPITAAGAQGLLVAPGAARTVVLAGLAPGRTDLAVRVRSRGAPVAAAITQSVLRGLKPGGIDYLTPVRAPALEQTVPGVVIPGRTGSLRRAPGFADVAPTLQVAVPGGTPATVRVEAFGKDGRRLLGTAGVVRARAGAVTTVDLSSLPAGTWGLSLRADVLVTAGVRSARGESARAPVDTAYTGAAAQLGPTSVVPVVPVGKAGLALTAPAAAATVTVRAIRADGSLGPARTVPVGAGRTVVVDPRGGATAVTAVQVQAVGGPVHAAQTSTEGTSGITVATVPPAAEQVDQVRLRIRP